MRPRWGGRRAAKLTAAVLARDQQTCYWCAGVATTADHYPIGHHEGGPDVLDNLVAACVPCNSRRGAQYGNTLRRADPAPSRRW